MTQESTISGRIDSLDAKQELILKQVWTYLLQFWGIDIDGTKIFNDPLVTSADKKKKKSLLGKLSGSSSTADSENTTAGTYTRGKIHDSLRSQDPKIIQDTFWKTLRTDSPDNLLLRFIRARKWDSDKAMNMLVSSLNWRATKYDANDIVMKGEADMYKNNEAGCIKNLELQKAVLNGFDKKGRPIVLVRPKLHHADDQTEEEIEKYSLLVIEQARLFLNEPTEAASILFDLTDFTMSNMDYQPVKFLITCFEAHYPESLGHLFIHKAPWIFSPIWNIIKKLLDPVVASKVVFTNKTKDLNKYIEMNNIPEHLGGTDTKDLDQFTPVDGSHDELLEDTATRDALLEQRKELIETILKTTADWIHSSDANESRALLNEKIKLNSQLSELYRKLDPYIRSRSSYDIDGTLTI
ncbi:hypothetical protein TPHA_0B02320 [Tetrapisispora phaffii CBS 4417]|uniref:CRAL-TRIO domain-containing protein n=1 Tax=Tetrapisispora phaffii (strain ATCC 24235 / CBS 4417 / NBRC 1672 / NRRL Y-8282 / UCD 70-5) TaxID=1071381 RepID=G8BPH3_TETPH|nr:hypothetical protein TPHA_0B02320 [Tetrapisispora phaffii CBS 4417]CCE61904.1 hypothetical protein TPHA_0B02320 [Tetrapisispora phaffii CBS 4417]